MANDSTHPVKASEGQPFRITIYQLAGDEMFAEKRPDGTGWEWCWADWRRDWMDQTPNKYAYRCLPLKIANQTGWWVRNPVGFTAHWNGKNAPGGVHILFDSDPTTWATWINDQFGHGIITWNTPFLFRTHPPGSRLLIIGPANYFKSGAAPLTAIIESDWMPMSFTMNWKITAPRSTIRFDQGEPLFQAIPLASNLCADLEQAHVNYMKLADDPEVFQAYHQWKDGREKFHDQKRAGDVKPDDWQKDYFQGRGANKSDIAGNHMTKVTAPKINYRNRES